MENSRKKIPLTNNKTPVLKGGDAAEKKLKTEVTPKKKKVVKKKVTKKKSIKKKSVKKKNMPAKKQSGDKVTLILDSVLVINDAEKIHVLLKNLIEKKQNIIIDASAIEMIDTAILQLFLSFSIKLRSLNIKSSWLNPSAEMLSRAHTLGLTEEIGLGVE